jgi:4-hydroxyphenylpyruvate dioxygenase
VAEYLQAYICAVGERFFFEIVERRGYRGFGSPNAAIRLAAQARLARQPAASW